MTDTPHIDAIRAALTNVSKESWFETGFYDGGFFLKTETGEVVVERIEGGNILSYCLATDPLAISQLLTEFDAQASTISSQAAEIKNMVRSAELLNQFLENAKTAQLEDLKALKAANASFTCDVYGCSFETRYTYGELSGAISGKIKVVDDVLAEICREVYDQLDLLIAPPAPKAKQEAMI